MTSPAGVVLAAGSGSRVRPLSLQRPKPLFPVADASGGCTTLLDRALAALAGSLDRGRDALAVNAFHLADRVVQHVGDRARVGVEGPEALGTAGALGGLRDWLDGRDVLVHNGDVRVDGPAVPQLLDGWDGARSRLLVVPAGDRRVDFSDDRGGWRYAGACLLPGAGVAALQPVPSGLYEVMWREQEARGLVELVPLDGAAVDCGTPADYLRAALHGLGDGSLVEPGAEVLGGVERCVVWSGARVGADERLRDVVRAGTPDAPVTVG